MKHFLLLFVFVASVNAQIPINEWCYNEWSQMSYEFKVGFIAGFMGGTWAAAAKYDTQYKDIEHPPLAEFAAYGVIYSIQDLMNLVDRVYQTKSNRNLAIILIVLEAEYFSRVIQ